MGDDYYRVSSTALAPSLRSQCPPPHQAHSSAEEAAAAKCCVGEARVRVCWCWQLKSCVCNLICLQCFCRSGMATGRRRGLQLEPRMAVEAGALVGAGGLVAVAAEEAALMCMGAPLVTCWQETGPPGHTLLAEARQAGETQVGRMLVGVGCECQQPV